jgi:chemotaxis protein methyltransferase CheR
MRKFSKSRPEREAQAHLAEIIEVMGRAHGLKISCFDESFLTKSIEKRLEVTARKTNEDYLLCLSKEPAEAEEFFRSLLVTYSEFFRNPLIFALLEQLILPGLIEAMGKSGRTELRIWSAGCAGGQEAYSVAILLDELIKAQRYSIPFRIFASDLSEADLVLARRGVFNTAALGNVRLRHLASYFSRQGESYTLAGRLRNRVDFLLYDLLDSETSCPPDCIYGDFDLIFCSNVLIYYRPETQRFILSKMQRCLAPGGYFITGDAEKQIVTQAGGFEAVVTSGQVFRLKEKNNAGLHKT